MAMLDEATLNTLSDVSHPALMAARAVLLSRLFTIYEEALTSGKSAEIYKESGVAGLVLMGSAILPRPSGDLDFQTISTDYVDINDVQKRSNTLMCHIGDEIGAHVTSMNVKNPIYGKEVARFFRDMYAMRFYMQLDLTEERIASMEGINEEDKEALRNLLTPEIASEINALRRKACEKRHGKYPDDEEIAKTGMPIVFVTEVHSSMEPIFFPLKTLNGEELKRLEQEQLFDQVLSLHPMDEVLRKVHTLMDPLRNKNPSAIAKDLYDFYIRTVANLTEQPNIPNIELVALDKAALTQREEAPKKREAIYDFGLMVLHTLPGRKHFYRDRGILPSFKYLDPGQKDSVARVAKGLRNLVEIDCITLRPEDMENYKDTARALMSNFWYSISVGVFGIENTGTKNNPIYTQDALPRGIAEYLREAKRGIKLPGDEKLYRATKHIGSDIGYYEVRQTILEAYKKSYHARLKERGEELCKMIEKNLALHSEEGMQGVAHLIAGGVVWMQRHVAEEAREQSRGK